jgi:hypothetical protein
MSTTDTAWLLLERIVQIVVCGTLGLLEGAVEPWINKKVSTPQLECKGTSKTGY